MGDRDGTFAVRNGARIGYEARSGRLNRRPWLVLVQGLGLDRTGWDPVVPGLRRSFRLLLVDNRGAGSSDAPPRVFSVPEMARDVVAVLDAAGVDRAHVAGTSLGGMVAQELAIEHADRVNGLVLASTTPGWPRGYGMPAPTLRLMAETRRLPREQALRLHVENALSRTTVEDDPALLARLVDSLRSRPHDADAWFALAAAGGRYYGGSRYRDIRADTLIMHGTADTVVDPRNSTVLAEGIADSRLVLLEGLGHLFFWERPDVFVEEVTRFLTRDRTPIPEAHRAQEA
jgi:pimeloyl-ACP methyl ester carboxylesterase